MLKNPKKITEQHINELINTGNNEIINYLKNHSNESLQQKIKLAAAYFILSEMEKINAINISNPERKQDYLENSFSFRIEVIKKLPCLENSTMQTFLANPKANLDKINSNFIEAFKLIADNYGITEKMGFIQDRSQISPIDLYTQKNYLLSQIQNKIQEENEKAKKNV